jgi:dihydrolipoamide dehydrogenase
MRYDVTIIGSGPGGYVAAIRCAQLGMKTAIVEKYPTLGGTCLNVGCIPSKALLDSSELFYSATKNFTVHGIDLAGVNLNWPQMRARTAKVVGETTAGVAYLMKKQHVTTCQGVGSFVDPHTIAVTAKDGKEERLEAARTIIATGSKPSTIPGVVIDKKRIISSTEALVLPEIPKELVVIGAGAIGLEMGSVFARLGTKVTVVEYLDSIIPTMDRTMGKELQRSLQKLGLTIHVSHKVQKASVDGARVTIEAQNAEGASVQFSGDYCLVAVGRRPYTDQLGLEKAGITVDKRGFIPVDEMLETAASNVFAIGDVIGGAMLAHKASEEGIFVAERMAGQKPHINYKAIPSVVYTWPEVASVGYSEEEIKGQGRAYKVGSFSYRALGRARAAGETDGLIKVLADKTTDEILGVHMCGARTADMIAEAVVALEYRASAEDIARMSHPHPTFSEAFREACLDATEKRSIHA